MFGFQAQKSKKTVTKTVEVQDRPWVITVSTRRDAEALIMLLNAFAANGPVGPYDAEALSRVQKYGRTIGGATLNDGHLPRKTQLTPAAITYFKL